MALVALQEVTVKTDHVTVDGIIWQLFRRRRPGLVEKVYDLLENSHLCDMPAVLPIGTIVTIPIEKPSLADKPVISLWD